MSSIEQYFDNIKYGSYPQNSDCDDLPIEYEQGFFTKRPIDCFANNIVERLKAIFIERSFDNRIYKSNPQNVKFDDLPFDCDERLITG